MAGSTRSVSLFPSHLRPTDRTTAAARARLGGANGPASHRDVSLHGAFTALYVAMHSA
jgi:hypothetical protein